MPQYKHQVACNTCKNLMPIDRRWGRCAKCTNNVKLAREGSRKARIVRSKDPEVVKHAQRVELYRLKLWVDGLRLFESGILPYELRNGHMEDDKDVDHED